MRWALVALASMLGVIGAQRTVDDASVVRAVVVHVDEAVGERPCWNRLVDAPVIDPFRPPECRWCPGNRGLEFGSAPGDDVNAPLDAVVSFDGEVAGVRFLTLQRGSGATRLLVTIGGLDPSTPRRARGTAVSAGELLGRASGAVHLGVRVAGEYADPARWLGSGRMAPMLIPVDGTAERSASRPASCT